MAAKITVFSGVDDQAEAIAQWRMRTKETGGRVADLRRKIKKHKEDHSNIVKARQTVEEVEALAREQDVYEKQLLNSDTNGTEIHNFPVTVHMRQFIKNKLTDIQHGISALKAKSRVENSLRDKILGLRQFIKEEMSKADADERALENTAVLDDQNVMLKIFSAAEEELCSSDNTTARPFLDALTIEKDEALLQLNAVSVNTTSPQAVLDAAQLILKMNQDHRRRSARVASSTTAEKMRIKFPQLSSSEINVAIAEAEKLNAKEVAFRKIVLHIKHVVDAIVFAHSSAIEGEAKKAELKKMIDADEEHLSRKKDYLHGKLQVQRDVFLEKEEQKRLEAEQLEREEEKKRLVFQKRSLKEFSERLRLLEEYEHNKAELQKKEEELRNLKEAEEQLMRNDRMKVNSKRVQFRHQLTEERRKECERREQELEIIRSRKAAAIQRFFDSVEEKLGVEMSSERVLKATKSSEQSTKYISFAEAGCIDIHGFTDEKIMRDPRVRLYHALLDAGLHKSSYGRACIIKGYHIPASQQTSDGNPFGSLFQ